MRIGRDPSAFHPFCQSPSSSPFPWVPTASAHLGSHPVKLSRKPRGENAHRRALVSKRRGSAFFQGSRNVEGGTLKWAVSMNSRQPSGQDRKGIRKSKEKKIQLGGGTRASPEESVLSARTLLLWLTRLEGRDAEVRTSILFTCGFWTGGRK